MESAALPEGCPGTYVLVLEVLAPVRIRAGGLGELDVLPGWYAYIGSALGPGGVAARCRHHMRISSRPHWHIDYLRAVSKLREIWFSCDSARREHTWSELVGKGRGITQPFPGFGASDCDCRSHLFQSSKTISFLGFRRRLYSLLPGHGPIRRIAVEDD
jgi:Uri superfamily endonuclease